MLRRAVSKLTGKPAKKRKTMNGKAGNGYAVPAADDLTLIDGIGPKLQSLLNDKGITRFDQIAALGPDEVASLDSDLGSFRGRITRDDWIAQARSLAAEG